MKKQKKFRPRLTIEEKIWYGLWIFFFLWLVLDALIPFGSVSAVLNGF